MRPFSSWGRLSAYPHHVVNLSDPGRVSSQMSSRPYPGLPFGMGRSYGDVCLSPGGTLWLTTGLDHFIAFDQENGRLVCDAGVLLRDIQRLAVPRGWMLPVTPGTQLVTVGGAIANDVHGKNHHRQGSFGDHIHRIRLARTDGELIECGPETRPDWFAATVGGLGLTGLIVEAEIQLCPVPGPWLTTETIPYSSLEEFFQLSEATEADWEHAVSWVDCAVEGGRRGLFMRGKPAFVDPQPTYQARQLTMPGVPWCSLVNKLSLRPFNMAYYSFKKRQLGQTITHYEPFFYPLDNLLEWNRMYGPKGFFQYQSLVPASVGSEAIRAMLMEVTRSGEGSFLAVIKTFGDRQGRGMLSFPRPGVTLALDFPNHGQSTHELLDRLDSIVREAGGCLYPAKDARMPRDLFEAGYPRLREFLQYRDPNISSGLSRRLMGS